MPSRKYCCVYGCLNCRRNKGMSFFTLPVDPIRRKKWLEAIGRDDLLQREINCKSYEVCALHFPLSMFNIKKFLTNDAVPALHLPQKEEQKKEGIKEEQKDKASDDDDTKSNNDENPEDDEDNKADKMTQTISSFVNSTMNVTTKRTLGTQTEGLSVSEREKKLFHMLRQSEKKRKKLEIELEELRKSKSAESSDSSEDDDDEDSDD